jgi:hypothetical protein
MHGRRGWVLLLLAAVFAMHGLQCAAADPRPATEAHGTLHSTVTEPGQALHLVGAGVVMASADALATAPLDALLPAAAFGIPSPGDHSSAPHAGGHLWALCLAVLAAGLAVLLIASSGRPPKAWLPLQRRSGGGSVGSLPSLRPPDPYLLCLMRI